MFTGIGVECDCDDDPATGEFVYPNAQEVVGNGVDDDCDGVDALQRWMMEPKFPTPGWARTGTVTTITDGVKVGGGGAAGTIARTFSVPMWHGQVHAVVDVTANTGSAFLGQRCFLDVKTNGYLGTGTIVTDSRLLTGGGTGTLVLGPLAVTAAPRTLKEVVVRCSAGASVSLDWLSIQNTADIVPPAGEMSVAWDDLDVPGGGLTTTMVRPAAVDGPLYAAADLGGVAYKDPADTLDTPWEVMNGTGSYGLTDQASVNVWDVLPVDWVDDEGGPWGDEPGEYSLFALSGRRDGTVLAGGLHGYDATLDRWIELADSNEDTTGEYQVGGYGRYSECSAVLGRDIKPYGGGKLLVQEPGMRGVYIANGDEGDLGVALWDGVEVCELPTATALPEGYVGALARVESYPSGLPALLVGYRGMGGSESSLYVCELPVDTLDADGDSDTTEPWVTCADLGVVNCTPVDDSLGMDIRDIEVDPDLPDVVYIADGGHDPSDGATCADGLGGLYQFEVTDSGGALDGALLDDLTTGLTDLGSGHELTGVSLDPDADFVFAFVPVSQDAGYTLDRIYRVPYDDKGMGAWEPINEDIGPSARDAGLDLSGGWLEATTVVKEAPYPAYFAPGHAIDAVWFTGHDSPTPDSCRGGSYYAAISTDVNAWRVEGLDAVEGCDGIVDWDPELDTDWVFWPEPDTTNDRTWQTAVVNDIAEDRDGNIWMPASDHGLFMQPAAGGPAELDCLWDFFNAGGNAVSVGEDGSVWIGFFDQSVGGSAYPHEMGVFRTLDGGASWEYQGAGVTNGNAFDEDLSGNEEFAWCKDFDSTHRAGPFGEDPLANDGNAFNDGSELISFQSWGNLAALAAVNEHAAVAAFQSYTGASAQTGKLAYTVNGGIGWTPVTFDGDWAGDGATSDDCDPYDFFEKVKGVSLVHRGVDTYAINTDADPDAEDWRLDMFVASRDNDTSEPSNGHCALARVTVTSAGADWTWFPLDRASTTIDCEVDEENMRGVTTLPWSDEVAVWGFYDYDSGVHAGGVCVIDIDDPTVVTEVVDPAVYPYSVADVAPHPYVNDLLFIAPFVDAGTWRQCREPGAPGCVTPYPMFAERAAGAWSRSYKTNTPPSLVATAAAWSSIDAGSVLYATEGAGAWRGILSW